MAEATAEERWLPIPGHEGYEVSDLGRVRSLDRVIIRNNGWALPLRGQLIRPAPDSTGHPRLVLDGRRSRAVHQLVLEAFVGPCPPGMWGLHENDNPADNRLVNLRWGTPSANSLDSVRNGTHYCGTRPTCKWGHDLVEPNLTRKGLRRGIRGCLACSRTSGCLQGYKRRGIIPPFDFQSEADRKYAQIMAGKVERPAHPRRRRVA